MLLVRWITLAVVVAATASPAAGHIQPSLNENNRYLKLTPLGDRIRLAYTVYFGEVPGAALRRQLDTDHDGMVSDAEADKLGREIAAEVLPTLSLVLDGAPVALVWSEVEVGMGTPEVTAGTFAVDLVASLCLPSRGPHELVLRDDYKLPIPGETELKVETGLGVTIVRISLGGSLVAGEDVRIRGTGGVLAAEGWVVKVDIGPAAPVGGGACGAGAAAGPASGPGARRGRPSQWYFVAMGAVAAALAAAVMVIIQRRRARRAR